MSYLNNHQIEIEERGYGDSNKSICSFHINDSFILKRFGILIIKANALFVVDTGMFFHLMIF